MKKLLLFLLLIPSLLHAKDVWLSSATVTVESGTLCTQGKRGLLHGLCVNTTAAASTVTIYNSSYTATGTVSLGNRNTNSAGGCHYYDIAAPKGLYYVKTGAADVTMIYDCY